jgi:hypothetical protein
MRWSILVLAATGCSHPKTPTKPMTDCSAAISAFGSADPARLRGLPERCTLADVSPVLTSLDATSRGILGPEGESYDIRFFSSSALEQITVWIDSRGQVVFLDAEKPPGTADVFLAALGEPEARLDYVWGDVPLKSAELVWPAKGVVLVASSGGKHLVRLGVFAPTTLADYQARLRYNGEYISDHADE